MIDITGNSKISEKTAAALGIFDGVHCGHRKIISAALRCHGLAPAIFTFPASGVCRKHGRPYEYIYTNRQKLDILERLGIKYICSPELCDIRHMSGEEFAENILAGKMNVGAVVCGENFRFGNGALCGPEELERFGKRLGFRVCVCSTKMINGIEISSEAIRVLLRKGDMCAAARLLGRNYFLDSEVVMGNRIGRTLDFPTINQIFCDGQLIPARGVYHTNTIIGGETYDSVTNVGVKPTVEKNIKPLAETHILGYSGNLYGKRIQVRFKEFIRSEIKFGSLEELKKQIKCDINYVHRLVEKP